MLNYPHLSIYIYLSIYRVVLFDGHFNGCVLHFSYFRLFESHKRTIDRRKDEENAKKAARVYLTVDGEISREVAGQREEREREDIRIGSEREKYAMAMVGTGLCFDRNEQKNEKKGDFLASLFWRCTCVLAARRYVHAARIVTTRVSVASLFYGKTRGSCILGQAVRDYRFVAK